MLGSSASIRNGSRGLSVALTERNRGPNSANGTRIDPRDPTPQARNVSYSASGEGGIFRSRSYRVRWRRSRYRLQMTGQLLRPRKRPGTKWSSQRGNLATRNGIRTRDDPSRCPPETVDDASTVGRIDLRWSTSHVLLGTPSVVTGKTVEVLNRLVLSRRGVAVELRPSAVQITRSMSFLSLAQTPRPGICTGSACPLDHRPTFATLRPVKRSRLAKAVTAPSRVSLSCAPRGWARGRPPRTYQCERAPPAIGAADATPGPAQELNSHSRAVRLPITDTSPGPWVHRAQGGSGRSSFRRSTGRSPRSSR